MISVIVPAKDASDCISECLQALTCQEGFCLGRDYEIIVVDDGSTDTTAQIAAGFPVKVHSQLNAGPAAARNAGARLAQGSVLAFTDADCIPAEDWLGWLTRSFCSPQVMGVKGVYRTHQKNLVARFVQLEYESKYSRMQRLKVIDFIDTYSAAYRTAVFLANGGFDETFPAPSVEDQEFSFRLARKGYTLIFEPRAAVYHRHDQNAGEYIRRKFGIGYWKAIMLRWLPEKTFSDTHTLPSQRLQIALLGTALLGLLILGLAALTGLTAGWVPGFSVSTLSRLAQVSRLPAVVTSLVALVLFFLSAANFFLDILHRDPKVLPAAPFLLLARAAALGSGLVWGWLFPPSGKESSRQESAAPGLSFGIRVVKRLLDVIGASIGLVLSAPVLGLAAVAIRMDSPGPAFYHQERSGENGKPFQMIKLRTMVEGADQLVEQVLGNNPLNGPAFKIPNDPRLTRVGRFLRRWSIDELPQMWNVLKGEMSLVGPRPEETWVVAQYDDRQRQRLAIKPGLTGPMQVSGRGDLDLEARLQLELAYLRDCSLGKDLEILWRSIPAVISGRGAY